MGIDSNNIVHSTELCVNYDTVILGLDFAAVGILTG